MFRLIGSNVAGRLLAGGDAVRNSESAAWGSVIKVERQAAEVVTASFWRADEPRQALADYL